MQSMSWLLVPRKDTSTSPSTTHSLLDRLSPRYWPGDSLLTSSFTQHMSGIPLTLCLWNPRFPMKAFILYRWTCDLSQHQANISHY